MSGSENLVASVLAHLSDGPSSSVQQRTAAAASNTASSSAVSTTPPSSGSDDKKKSSTKKKKKKTVRAKDPEHVFPVQPRIIQTVHKPKTFMNHSYRDFSSVPAEINYETPTKIDDMSFSQKVHDILSQEEYKNWIAWRPHGRAFQILIPKRLEHGGVLKKYFGHNRYSSFLRQLNNFGFKHVSQGKDRNCYYHEFMLRGLPHLCQYMPRSRDARRLIPDPENEPDFDTISRKYPVPGCAEAAAAPTESEDQKPPAVASVAASAATATLLQQQQYLQPPPVKISRVMIPGAAAAALDPASIAATSLPPALLAQATSNPLAAAPLNAVAAMDVHQARSFLATQQHHPQPAAVLPQAPSSSASLMMALQAQQQVQHQEAAVARQLQQSKEAATMAAYAELLRNAAATGSGNANNSLRGLF